MTINQVMQTFVILVMLPILPVSMEMYLKKCVIPIFVLHNLLRWQRDIDKICDKIVQLF